MFDRALDEAISALEGQGGHPVTITSARDGSLVVPLSSIAYAEGRAHVICYHMTNGRTIESRTMRQPFAKAVQPLLTSGQFLQSHQSFAVNLDKIFRLSGQNILLTDGTNIPIARARAVEVKNAYIDYLSR